MPTVAAPTDDEARFRAEIATLRRINRVAWPILAANADACAALGLSGLTVGIAAVNQASFPARRQPLAEKILAIGFEPRVCWWCPRVRPHSRAACARTMS
ncbi:MAG: hypothetical protein WDO24_16415 [Pseudomonadota bacterium]